MYSTIAQAVIIVLLVLFSIYSWGEKKETEQELEKVEQANKTILNSLEQLKEDYNRERQVLIERHENELKNASKYEKVIKYVYDNNETNATKRFNSVLDKLQFDKNSSN